MKIKPAASFAFAALLMNGCTTEELPVTGGSIAAGGYPVRCIQE